LLPAPRVPIRNKLWISPKCIRSRELFGSKLAPEPGLRVAKRGQTTFSGDSRAGQRDNVLRGPQRFDQRRRKVHHAVAPEVGFEPTTNRLTADRSTTELLWIISWRLTHYSDLNGLSFRHCALPYDTLCSLI